MKTNTNTINDSFNDETLEDTFKRFKKEAKEHKKRFDQTHKVYKLVSECQTDLISFLYKAKYRITLLKIKHFDNRFGESEAEIRTDLTMAQMLKILSKIEDSHIIARTLKLKDEFNGDGRPMIISFSPKKKGA